MSTISKHTILVVDDEKANLAVLNQILSPEYGVFTAKSGTTAIQIAEELRPDLVLLDIVLPDINGFDVLSQLKANPNTRTIPVIFITGLGSDSDEEKGLLLGAVDYIKKPFKHTIVKARVRTHMDIVQQVRAIERLGLTDSLTGLPNRRSFDDRVEMEWRRAIRERKTISLLMLDLDNFKSYNDTYGHPQGDILLKKVSGIFATVAKRPADLPARVGGEEFAILLPDTGLDSALSLAESVRADVESLRVPADDGNAATSMTISIGVISAAPIEDSPLKDFLSIADKNLYAAKKAGKNRVFPQGAA
ncbi:MAG: diguanylate cyclase [Clostridiales Family XIII bacterium]|jgi:diguanylate cyclase (GGDEF)-like protein|nr:diguanylate cyclase [Clostridiales Family XIII bacterium]